MADEGPDTRIWALTIRSPRALSEEVSRRLWDEGASGIWEKGDREWVAYFEQRAESTGESLPEADPNLAVQWHREAQTDWAARFQESLRPFPLGAGFTIMPREGADNPWPERRTLLLVPGTAFGTGEHFTTASCFRALDALHPVPRSFLDIGCGTGILAVAAAMMGVSDVSGCDIDPEAVRVARLTARANGVEIDFREGDAGSEEGRFACVAANILAETLIDEMASIAARVAPGGKLILSGILCEKGPSVLKSAQREGFFEAGARTDGRWWTYTLSR